MFAFPVSLDVGGRRCVVVGDGPLAAEKVDALADAGADVVAVVADAYEPALLDGALLVVWSGEGDLAGARVHADAESRGVLCNAMDDIPHCHFAFPSIVRRGDLKVAISTAGRAPALARRVRLRLEELLPEALGELIDVVADAREEALPRTLPWDEWVARWRSAVDDLDLLVGLVEAGDGDEVRERILSTLRSGEAEAGSAADRSVA